MDINEILQNTLSAVIIGVLGLLSTYVLMLINKATVKIKEETERIKDERQRKLLSDAINRVNDLAMNAVIMANQTIVSELKLAIANGTVNRSELLALGKKVANDIYIQLAPSLKKVLETEILDVEAYILSVVETQVANLKPIVSTDISQEPNGTVVASNIELGILS